MLIEIQKECVNRTLSSITRLLFLLSFLLCLSHLTMLLYYIVLGHFKISAVIYCKMLLNVRCCKCDRWCHLVNKEFCGTARFTVHAFTLITVWTVRNSTKISGNFFLPPLVQLHRILYSSDGTICHISSILHLTACYNK